jgi:hypothetical protein
MAGRGALAFSGLFMALSIILATVPENGSVAGGPGLSTRTEWSSEWYTHGLQYNLSDTDGDGTSELLVWVSSLDDGPKGTARLFVYDQPGYKLAFSARLPGDIRPDVRDLDGDGIPELAVVSMGAQHNITIFSGRTYAVKWKSPDFCDSSLYYQVSDIDADGELELVWYGMYDTGSAPPAETGTRIHAYGASSYKEKLNLSDIDGWSDGFSLRDLDADAAKECVLVTHVWRGNCLAGTRLRIVDCASGRMQWETADDPAVDRFSQPQFADINNDSKLEVLAAVRETDPVNGSTSSLRIYSGENGSLIRSFNAGRNIQDFEAVDVDGDRCREILLTTCTEENPWSPTCTITLEVMDPMEDKVLWSLGPIPGTGQGGTSLDGRDLTGDGVPEIIVTNYTWGKTGLCSKASYTVLDGSDLSTRWTSPQFGGKTEDLVAVDQDLDGVLEIIVPDTAVGADGRPTDRLHIFSTDDFREEWTSGEFVGGIVSAECRQIRGDGTPEILLSNLDVKNGTDDHTWQKILLDGGTRSTIWSSPRRPGVELESSNLVDGPGSELFVVGNTWKLGEWRSEMWLYDGSSFGLIWTSGRLADYYSMIATGDIDNDAHGEVLLWVERDNDGKLSDRRLAVYEFSAPLGPGTGPAGEEQRFPVVSENTAQPGTGGGAAPVLLAAAAITVASASTGATALVLSRRKRKAAPEPASPVVAGRELSEHQPGEDVEIRR